MCSANILRVLFGWCGEQNWVSNGHDISSSSRCHMLKVYRFVIQDDVVLVSWAVVPPRSFIWARNLPDEDVVRVMQAQPTTRMDILFTGSVRSRAMSSARRCFKNVCIGLRFSSLPPRILPWTQCYVQPHLQVLHFFVCIRFMAMHVGHACPVNFSHVWVVCSKM